MKLTENLVLGKSRATDVDNVRKLNCWGSELTDISILRKMTNVQVVSLSVNKIAGLEDFSYCKNLEELYIRKNEIKDLREIRHLKKLPKLTKLWLADNPCANVDKYRLTVLKALPNLQKLDNINVSEDELNQAVDEGNELDAIKQDAVDNVQEAEDKRTDCGNASEETANKEPAQETTEENKEIGAGESTTENGENDLEPGEVRPPKANPVMISWDETNKIRQQLGLKPLPVEKVTQLKPRTTSTAKSRNSNLLQAALHLVKELDADSLELLSEAVRNRLEDLV